MKLNSTSVTAAFGMVFRYAVSGFAGIGVNLLIFSSVLRYIGPRLVLASVLGFLGAYVVTFLMHKYWTFKNTSRELFRKQSIVYFFSAIGTLIINTSVLYILVSFGKLEPVLAQFLSLLTAAFLSFLFTTQVTFHINESRILSLTNFSKPSLWHFIKEQRVWFGALFLIMCVCVFLRVTVFPLTFTTDSESYVETAKLLSGDTTADIYGERILKPLAPAVVALTSVFGIDFASSLLLQAIVLYIVLGYAVFWFGYELFKRPEHAFAMSVLIVTSYPIFRYGINYYTETGIWVLYFAALAAIVRWMRKPSFTMLFVISVFLLLGLLWKEYAVLAGAIFGLCILFHTELTWREKFHAFLQTGFFVLIPWGIWQYAVLEMYDYSYLNWLSIGSAPSAYSAEYTFINIGKTFFALLLTAWPLCILGIYKWDGISGAIKKMILLMLIPSFGFLLWGFVSSRLFFAVVPLLAPFAVVGFMALPSKLIKISFVLLVIVANSILMALAFDPSVRIFLNNLS